MSSGTCSTFPASQGFGVDLPSPFCLTVAQQPCSPRILRSSSWSFVGTPPSQRSVSAAPSEAVAWLLLLLVIYWLLTASKLNGLAMTSMRNSQNLGPIISKQRNAEIEKNLEKPITWGTWSRPNWAPQNSAPPVASGSPADLAGPLSQHDFIISLSLLKAKHVEHKNVAPKNTQTRAKIHPDQHVTCSEISMKSRHLASFPAPWWFLPPSRTACFALVTSASSSSPSHGMASPSNGNPSSKLFAITVVVIRTYHSTSSKKTSNISAYPQKSHQF